MSTSANITTDGVIVFLPDGHPPVVRSGKAGDQLTLDAAGELSWLASSSAAVTQLKAAQFSGDNVALADGVLSAGDFSLWLDNTNGATVLHAKAKSANGTVVVCNIPNAVTSYSGTVIADAPLVYYRMNDVSGNPVDSSGNGNNVATFQGAHTYSQSGARAGATSIKMSGTGHAASGAVVPQLTAAGQTIEAWAYITDAGTFGPIITVFRSGAEGYSFGVGAAGNFAGAGNQLTIVFGGVRTITTGVTVGTGWHHFVLVLTATNGYPNFYIDGVLVYSDTTGAPTTNALSSFFDMGRNANLGGNWNDKLEDMAVYTSALTAGQVAAHFAAKGA